MFSQEPAIRLAEPECAAAVQQSAIASMRPVLVAAIATAFALSLSTAARAATITVNSLADPAGTATPVGCIDIPGTSTPVGAGCFTQASCPALTTPQDPVTYGADKTGATNSEAAFQSAFDANAGDIYISEPGTYLINSPSDQGGPTPLAGQKIECAPGVTLETTLHGSPSNTGIFIIKNSNNTICGCNFTGTDTGRVLDTNQYNWLIYSIDGNTGLVIEGNTFENSWGNAAIQVDGASQETIKFNTFTGNAYYGPTINQGDTFLIENNLSDSPIGPEAGSCSGTSNTVTHATITLNYIKVGSIPDCAGASPPNSGCDSSVFITGGEYPPGCDYSTNVVTGNYCQGNSGVQAATIDNIAPASGGVGASHSGNVLGPGCSVRRDPR
jgi:Right handed beta helix region